MRGRLYAARSFPVKGRLFYTSGPYKTTEEIHYAFDH